MCKLIGIDYDDEFPWDKITPNTEVFMVDFHLQPFEDMVKLAKSCKLTWIDHHKSALDDMNKYRRENLFFLSEHCERRINIAYAACELTWMYLYPKERVPPAVHLLGRYDIWDHNDERTLPFQYGMRLYNSSPDEKIWSRLFEEIDWFSSRSVLTERILQEGQTVLKYIERYNAKHAHFVFEVEFDGLRCIALNKLIANSQLFDSIWDKEKYHAMVAFGKTKSNRWIVSIYTDRDDMDLSEVAKKRGGGGHKGAAGFYCETLPWEE